MERTCSDTVKLRRLRSNRGAAPMKTLIILMCLAIIVSFTYQVFVAYSAANTVSTTMERCIMSVASFNKPGIYYSLREGEAFAQNTATMVNTNDVTNLLCEELGLEVSGTDFVKRTGASSVYYTISDLRIEVDNDIAAGSQTVVYTADFVLDVPVAAYWSFGSFTIPMHVEARYTGKY